MLGTDRKPAGTRASERSGRSSGWIVSIEIRQPEDGYALHPATHKRVTQALKGHAPVLKVGKKALSVVFSVESRTANAAQRTGVALARDVLDLLGLNADAISGFRVYSDAAVDNQIRRLPDCVGVGEAATILGVSKQRVHQLAQREDFPAPVLRLRATPVWREADIRRLARKRARGTA